MAYYAQYDKERIVYFGTCELLEWFKSSRGPLDKEYNYARISEGKFDELLSFVQNIQMKNEKNLLLPQITKINFNIKELLDAKYFKVMKDNYIVAFGRGKDINEYKESLSSDFFEREDILILEITYDEYQDFIDSFDTFLFSEEVSNEYYERNKVRYFKIVEDNVTQGFGVGVVLDVKINKENLNTYNLEISKDEFNELNSDNLIDDDIDVEKREGYTVLY